MYVLPLLRKLKPEFQLISKRKESLSPFQSEWVDGGLLTFLHWLKDTSPVIFWHPSFAIAT